jgi:predicted O-methyltransferase YrrM
MTGGGSSIPEVHRLLAVLATGRRCAEAGTAFGEGTRALASTAGSVVSVEIDPERAALAAAALTDLLNVELLLGDWKELLLPRGPFDLFFLDSGGFKEAPGEIGRLAIDLLAPGGTLIADDMVPGLEDHDAARRFLFEHSDLTATEILTTPTTSALIATRIAS